MRVFIDLDGVVCDFYSGLFRIANELWPGIVPNNYWPTDYDCTDIFNDRQWDDIWIEIKKAPDFWKRVPAIEENVIALRTWIKKDGPEIYYITARQDTGAIPAYQQTVEWLIHHGIYPPHAWLIVVKNPAEKSNYIEKFKIDYGIDDLPATVNVLNMISWHHCYLLNAPHNQNSNQRRVSSVQEFLDIVDLAAAHHPDVLP